MGGVEMVSPALGDSLTSRLQDGLERLPAFSGTQLERVGQVVLARYATEEGFFVL